MAWTKKYGKEYRAKKLEELRKKNADYYTKNREQILEKQRQYYAANREKVLQKTREYVAKHPEQHRANVKQWAAAHPERRREIALASARRSRAENPEKNREAARKYRLAHPDRVKSSQRKYHQKVGRFKRLELLFEFSAEDYQAMLEAQHGLCALCGEAPDSRGLMVDHCHARKVVRALLCNACNCMLGHGKDNPKRLRLGIEYLAKHGITETISATGS